ncbi:hypothetical protein LCGC14_1410090 [marine sediment metagenome]|uniref:Uncharacterized protein n=1 Tax=marine sediment metagenome TaxID=412755 RepID=A0A0F9JUU6_9ZZZZ
MNTKLYLNTKKIKKINKQKKKIVYTKVKDNEFIGILYTNKRIF